MSVCGARARNACRRTRSVAKTLVSDGHRDEASESEQIRHVLPREPATNEQNGSGVTKPKWRSSMPPAGSENPTRRCNARGYGVVRSVEELCARCARVVSRQVYAVRVQRQGRTARRRRVRARNR